MAPPGLRHLVVAAAAFFLATVAVPVAVAQVQAQEHYCRDSLAGLKECDSFMYGGASAPSPACCAAYEAAFDADPFCLCYVADGTYGRATGNHVDVDHALQIPATCGQAQPPVELCNMEGLVLPPYAPQGTAPMAQPPGRRRRCSQCAAAFRLSRVVIVVARSAADDDVHLSTTTTVLRSARSAARACHTYSCCPR